MTLGRRDTREEVGLVTRVSDATQALAGTVRRTPLRVRCD
jgi:hypothetical protein